MSIANLFSRFDQLGITLQLQDNQLKVQAPKGKLTPDLINELKEKKEEIIGFLKKHVQKKEKHAHIEPVERKEYYPLSSAQKRLYILYQLNKQSTGYNMPSVLEVQSEDTNFIHRLEQIFIRLVNRHESFRTSFTILNEEPVQRVLGKKNKFRIIDRYPPLTDTGDQVTGTIKKFIRPFDLSQAPLLRVSLLPIGDTHYIMMVDMHHIISDGTSIEILIAEFLALQQGEAENTLPELKLRYRDYSEWQRQRIEKEKVTVKQEAYWLKEFAGELPVLNLPYDYPRPAIQSFVGETVTFELERQNLEALNRLVNQENVTLFMVLLTLLNILLGKLSGQEDIVIGIPAAGRVQPDLEPIIGMFVSTLALRNYPLAECSFTGFLSGLKTRTLKAFENQDYPFEHLVEKTTAYRDAGRNPLFDVMFALHNMRENTGTRKKPGSRSYENKISRFDMIWMASENEEQLDFEIEYCTRLFKKETIERFITYFKKIVTAVISDPGMRVSRIEILSEKEKQRILYDFNDTTTGYEGDETLHGLFSKQVKKTPDHVALVLSAPGFQNRHNQQKEQKGVRQHIQNRNKQNGQNGDRQQVDRYPDNSFITYSELDEKSGQLTCFLRQQGVIADMVVGLLMERSIELIIGIMAILKAGGAYLPIDPALPQQRIISMLKDSEVSIILSQEEVAGSLSLDEEFFLTSLSSLSSFSFLLLHSPHRFSVGNHGSMNRARDLLYVIYTSGSTGKPKGVMLEHRNLANLIRYQSQQTRIDLSAVLQFTTISFDVSAQEIFSTLLAGGRLSLVPRDTLADIPALLDLVKRNNIKTLFLPASFLKFLMSETDYVRRIPGCVTHIVTAGEQAIINETFKQYLQDNNVHFHNHYGPSETHVVTALTLAPAETFPYLPPIGRPVSNTEIYILDKGLLPVPIGVPGQLFIGGIQVGRGYLNNPELTAEKFCLTKPGGSFYKNRPLDPHKNFLLKGVMGRVPGHRTYENNQKLLQGVQGGPNRSPLPWAFLEKSPPNRMSAPRTRRRLKYKTGDLARWLENGNIKFLGRLDYQVKIRGFRVELGEIENHLLNHQDIKDAVVLAKNSEIGNQYLCAYFVSPGQDRELVEKIKEHLTKKLPAYMIPAYFVQLEKIPITPNGKIDRKKLPEPQPEATEEYVAPGDEIQTKLVELWSDILELPEHLIGIESDFFKLGGHSLKATILMTRIHQSFNVKLSLVEIFRQPSIKALGQYIKDSRKAKYVSIEPIEKRDYYPLSSPQKRLYLLQQMDLESTVYHISHALELKTEHDIDRLEQIFGQLICRHESFLTSFVTVDEEPVQRIQLIPEKNYKLQITKYKQNTNNKPQITNIIKKFIRPFDLSNAPLLRVGLIEIEKSRHFLLLDMHHIISDGTSLKILMAEFQNRCAGQELPELRIQYKDYTHWQASREIRERSKDQETFWVKQFSNHIPVLDIITDFKRPPTQSFAGGTLGFEIEPEQAEKLKTVAWEQGATLFMELLAIVNILLSKLARQEDIVIGTPTSGRRHADLHGIIGMFVNTLALRNYPLAGKTFSNYLAEVKKNTLEAFDNQDYAFEELVEQTVKQRDASRNPLFDVMFALQEINEETDIPGKPGTYLSENSVSRFDMAWLGTVRKNRLNIEIEYCTSLFKSETIRKFSDYFKHIIAAVTTEPGIRISHIEIISAEEKQQILDQFNDTASTYPADMTIHGIFEEQVKKTPHHIALAGEMLVDVREKLTIEQVSKDFPRVHLTYGELNDKAHHLAFRLRENGIENETIAGIMVEPSVELITGLLAILKAGGAYLPIDPAYPEERIEYMLTDSSAKILLTSASQEEKVKKIKKNPGTIFIDSFDFPVFTSSQRLNFSLSSSSSLAYIIYTSGSTGRPKGVMVQHQNVVRLVKNCNFIDVSPLDRLLPTGNIVFDISTFEIWWPLLNGLALYPVNQHIILEGGELRNVLIKNRISILHLIPQLFNQLSGQYIEIFSRLRYFLVGGDLVQPQYVNMLRKTCPQIKILHMYGPTENTTFSTFHPVHKDYHTAIPIGKPISNSVVMIVDKTDKLVPIGIPGELLVGGEGVARGYLNKAGLTLERFINYKLQITKYKQYTKYKSQITNKEVSSKVNNKKLLRGGQGGPNRSFLPGIFLEKSPPGRRREKQYKTGDLARWQSDGNIEFLGRMDQQVKIRGSRIEPGEIENRLLEHPGVKQAVVTFNRDETEDKFLIAYIVPDHADMNVIDQLRDYLSQKLPVGMIPSYFLQLEQIPLTANGKLDVNALPEPRTGKPGKIIVHPRSNIEIELVKIWAEVLNISSSGIGIDNNFFELGGHSLKAARVMANIQTRLNARLSLQEIFKFPTIRQLGPVISAAGTTPAFIPNVEKQEYYPVSYNQARVWNFQCQYPGSNAYNLFERIPFIRSVPVQGIRETLFKLIRRHESFRTRFGQVNGCTVQFIEPQVDIPLELFDLSSLAGEKKQVEAERIYEENCRKPFDLTVAPLFRAILLKMGNKGDEFILIMHHIISDGWSHELLKKEFQAYYQGFLAGKEITLSPQPLQYRDFAGWQRQRFRDSFTKERVLHYWKKNFEQGFPELELPFDPGGNPEDHSGITYRSVIPQAIKKPLQHLGETHQTSLFMVLFSTFNLLMSSLSGQSEIVCRVPAAGRDQPELQHIMGYLVNSVIIKNHVKENEPFVDLLHRVTENTLTAFQYQWYPLELVLENLRLEYPHITVSFNMLSMQESEAETDLEQWDSYFTEDLGEAKFPLILRITVYRNGIEITWDGQKALFKPTALEKMACQYIQLLKHIANEEVDIEFSR